MTSRLPTSALRGLASISEPAPRAIAVKERLARLGPERFTIALDRLARGAARGAALDLTSLLACARFFVCHQGDDDGELDPMRATARREGLVFAAAILAAPAPHKALTMRGRLRDAGGPSRIVRDAFLSTPPTDDDEWRTRARYEALEAFVRGLFGPSSTPIVRARIASLFDLEEDDLLTPAEEESRAARLAELGPTRTRIRLPRDELRRQRRRLMRRAMVPEVLRRLLLDPSVTPGEVLALAAARPTSAAIVSEICGAAGWLERLDVRSALVQNPFTPTATALWLTPACRPRFAAILRANVHPAIHALTRLCLGS